MVPVAVKQRIFWSEHQGVPFLMLDFAGATVSESLALMDDYAAALRGKEAGSVRMMSDVTDAEYDPAVANKWKALRIQNDTYIRASAIYGLSGLVGVAIRAFLELLDMLGMNRAMKKFRIFKTREQALAWLIKA